MPIDELESRLSELPQGRTIVAYCRGPYCLMAKDAVDLLKRRGLDAVEDARDRGRGVAGQQPGNHHVGVDDDGLTAHDLRRTACTCSCATASAWSSGSLPWARARRTRSRASARDLMP